MTPSLISQTRQCDPNKYWQTKYRGLLTTWTHLSTLNQHSCLFHPIWTTAKSPFEVIKFVVTARLLSGRYTTYQLMSNSHV